MVLRAKGVLVILEISAGCVARQGGSKFLSYESNSSNIYK